MANTLTLFYVHRCLLHFFVLRIIQEAMEKHIGFTIIH